MPPSNHYRKSYLRDNLQEIVYIRLHSFILGKYLLLPIEARLKLHTRYTLGRNLGSKAVPATSFKTARLCGAEDWRKADFC
jgi:hypothetical protein